LDLSGWGHFYCVGARAKYPDMKGNATTPQVADAICKIILR
ncbi:hypothetical protein ACUOFC_65530, partial [Escherichia sp. TWPC-MK]